ncbi:hypothetical protein SAMN05444372_111118 [Flavobacterium micromati]|uniref:DUF748 domain-containing protein n=1 Tax=Flavobacterium micromati TaxID=229205 RepID=A0A1M5NL33_9FLAO|nr:hypothetical protein [Flavobacterium micromati]SHG90260.1 hypothetical protein SAMN05444372_111118 [Flavobacterium micromati]
MKERVKKIGVVILGIIIFIGALSFAVNLWVNYQLPKIILDKNETPYNIKYENVKISLFSRKITASGIVITPKERQKDRLSKNGILASIENVTVDDYKIFPLLLKNKIEAYRITFSKPNITLFKDNDKIVNSSKNLSSKIVAPFEQIIKVANVNIENGNFSIVNIKNNKTLFSAQKVIVQLNDLAISKKTLDNKIPFSYKSYALSCDSLIYQTDKAYQIKATKINTTNSGLEMDNFSMTSLLTRRQFVDQSKKERDLYTLKAGKIAIKNMNWGFKEEILFFKTNQIVIDKADANIYRSKIPKDNLSIKPLYSKILRELKFDLLIDTLTINNSNLVYEEEKTFNNGAGVLKFGSFNLQATNVYSGYQNKNLPDVLISINCKFMNKSPMMVKWRFNVMDKSDGFNIKGSIKNFETNQLAIFTKPYLNTTFKGTFDQVYFDYNGNDNNAKGNFALRYHDLNIERYQKKNRDKKSVLKSWLGNLVLKNDSGGKILENEIEVQRIKEKSFFNLFWLCFADGLKKTLL